jgi:pilus assembly protein Flp/PilA
MTSMATLARRFARDECAATAIEYGLMAALIAVAGIAAFTTLGNGLANLFGSSSTGAGGAMETAATTVSGS